MPNPQLGAAQPTQDEDPQAFCDLPRGKLKNPSQSPWLEPETITFLRSMILAAPMKALVWFWIIDETYALTFVMSCDMR